MDHADDIEDSVVKDRQAAEALAPRDLGRGRERGLLGDRLDSDQRHHRLARLGMGEAEDAPDHLLLGRQDRVSVGSAAGVFAPYQQCEIFARKEHAADLGRDADQPAQAATQYRLRLEQRRERG